MSRFNSYLNTHFKSGGCRLIARARDDCRERDVEIYAVPGETECVGVTDGTDAWIAPAAAAPFFRTATGDVQQIMRALKDGVPLPPVPDAPPRARKRVRLADPEQVPPPAAEPQQLPERKNRVRL